MNELLLRKIRQHNWNAEPDDSHAMLERLEILHELRAIPFKEAMKIVEQLSPEIAAQVMALANKI